MRKDIQGKLSITLSIPDEYNNNDIMRAEYVRQLALKIAKLDLMKEYHNVMIISEVEQNDDGTDFLDDKEYYEDYYDVIFPEDLED